MNSRGGTRRRALKKPVIVLAGEDANDRQCLRVVIEALCPEARARIVEVSDAVRLRQAGDVNLRERVNKLASLVKARALREDAEIAAVFVHEDFDEIDSGQRGQVRGRVQQALNSKLNNVFYILAVWEIEAWLLLFPEAISATRRSWVLPQKYHGRDTGRVRDPKRVMMREVSVGGPRYRESDAPTVIKKAAELALLRSLNGKNSSWEEFVAYVDAWCIARRR